MSAATDMDRKAGAKNSRPDNKPASKPKPVTKNGLPVGRPSGYSPEVANRICDHIANGGYSTHLDRFGLPSSSTLARWLNENEAFREQYARAREQRAEHFANEIVEIADTDEDPQRARVRIEARKWVASKLLPRVYGENQRVEVEHGVSQTAARVLMELTQRANQRKQLEAPIIDVTPEDEGQQ